MSVYIHTYGYPWNVLAIFDKTDGRKENQEERTTTKAKSFVNFPCVLTNVLPTVDFENITCILD